MCNRYPCDKSLVDLLLLCCYMQQQKGGGLCFVCSMPRPRGDHPHGKPGGRVSMVVNTDHMQVTCMPQFNRLHTSFPFSFSLTDALCFSAADILSSGV